jgi:hypothetical protein
MMVAALCTVAGASIAACASSTPYNPYHLDTARVTQIAGICQTVVGLQPSEPQVENLWPGDPDPELSTNRYRGCIASLSDSVKYVAVARVNPVRVNIGPPTATPFGDEEATDVNTSIAETLRRNRRACADIGLEEGGAAFAGCVRGLQDVLSAEDMNANYSN